MRASKSFPVSWPILLGLILPAAPVLVTVATAQETDAHDPPTGDLLAGLYFSNRSSLNGLSMHFRYLLPVAGYTLVGGRLDFRDDDRSRGRNQAIGLGAEAMVDLTELFGWYLVGGMGITINLIGDVSALSDPDARNGLTFHTSVGGGLALGRVLVEGRLTAVPKATIGSISLGARGSPRDSSGSSIAVRGATYLRTRDTYERSDGYRGYSLTYKYRPARSRVGFRSSIGIDFLDFTAAGGAWSTGAVTLLLGMPVVPLSWREGSLTIGLVPEVGAWFFSEPDSKFYPLGRVSAQVGVGAFGAALVGETGMTIGAGPAGTFTGLHAQMGVRLAL